MFNTYELGKITNSVNLISPCVGTLQKSHPLSRFARFHQQSVMSKYVFSGISRLKESGKPITVLQVMVFGGNEFLIEYVYDSDLINTLG